ncbi:MAG: hypothetical protein KJO41_10790 [Bacteroidia bacterium]|nr:hypothetical protein [Bacteroidia bacterium]MBT8279480.1 hypothetical protein [Bacteroidia bacterium]
MHWLKQRWEITRNWQLLYLIVGVAGLVYSSYKLALLFDFSTIVLTIISTAIIFTGLLKITLALFNFLEKRWKVDQKWKVIRIFLVFAITGSLSIVVTKPIFEAIGLTRVNFGDHFLAIGLFYILKFILVLPFYKVMLVCFGWIFGEFQFFLNFTIKLANRLGLKKITQKFDSKE